MEVLTPESAGVPDNFQRAVIADCVTEINQVNKRYNEIIEYDL